MLRAWLIGFSLTLLMQTINGQASSFPYLSEHVQVRTTEKTILQVLEDVENQLNINFVYSNVVNTTTAAVVLPGDYLLEQLLDSLFSGQDLNYYTRENLVILSPKEQVSGKYQISGRVLNEKGKNSIPYASVFVIKKAIGTITNHDGRFLLNIEDVKLTDSVQVSAIGYETKVIPVRDFMADEMEIRLSIYRIPIKEVVIRHADPVQLVKESYLSRSKNYPLDEEYFQGYFREINQQDEKYISLSEALVEIAKRPYKNNQNDWIKISKGRVGENTENSELLNLVVQGGLYTNLQLDLVKYHNSFYSDNPTEEYNLWMERSVLYRNRHTFIVGFNMKEGLQYAGFKGKMYIDAESLALTHAEFEFNPKAINIARDVLIRKIASGYKARPVYARYEVDYRNINGEWLLSHTRSEIGIKVKSRRRFNKNSFACDFVSTSELVITNKVDAIDTKMKPRDSARPNDVFVDQLKAPTVEYWQGQTIIPPEEPLEQALKRLMQEGNLKANQEFLTFDRSETEPPR